VFAVPVDHEVVHDVVQGVVEEALGDLRQARLPLGGRGHGFVVGSSSFVRGGWKKRRRIGVQL
jgi:hypothetical protein